MNKISYFLLVFSGFVLASCSNEAMESPQISGDINCSVTVKIPHLNHTRAVTEFGLGFVANNLSFAVYDAASGSYIEQGTTTFAPNETGALETSVDFNLAKNKPYQIVFFAQSPASADVYVFDAAAKTMTVNYGKMTSVNNLNDAYDCFYGSVNVQITNGSYSAECVLTRPVAQVNWGTNDLTNTNGNPSAAAHDEAYGANGQWIVTNLTTAPYTVLNLLDGTVSDNSKTVTISSFGAPYSMTFPDTNLTGYIYVGMQYLLAPSAGATYSLDLAISNAGKTNTAAGLTTSVAVANVPVQSNYQTNIYGALLTDNVNINVVKNPDWFIPANNEPYPQPGSGN